MKKFMGALLTAVLTCCAAEAVFKAEPIPDSQAMEGFASSFGFAGEQKSPFEKEPEYKGARLYGNFFMAGKQLPFVKCSSPDAGKPDTIIIDLNDNKDLTDDPVLVVGEPASIQLPQSGRFKVTVQNFNGAANGFVMRPADWYRGKIDLGGKQYEAIMVDLDMNGIDAKGQDCLLIDLNGDGKFEMNAAALRLEGYSPLKGTVVLAGDAWDVAFDEKGPDVKLTRYPGDCGTLRVDLQLGKGTGEPEVMAYLPREDSALMISFKKGLNGTRLPAGEYERSLIMATVLKDGKPVAMLQCSGPQPLVIKKDETKNIVIGPPEGMTVQVEKKDGKLEIGRTMKSGQDAEISQMTLIDQDGKTQGIPPPSVKIVSPENAEVLAQGVMKYG